MTIEQFVKLANDKRKLNKNSWVFLTENVEGINVEYKAYGTWIQVMRMGFIRTGTSMNISVKAFKYFLNSALTSELAQIENAKKGMFI